VGMRSVDVEGRNLDLDFTMMTVTIL
jgi:hypothetical protein